MAKMVNKKWYNLLVNFGLLWGNTYHCANRDRLSLPRRPEGGFFIRRTASVIAYRNISKCGTYLNILFSITYKKNVPRPSYIPSRS